MEGADACEETTGPFDVRGCVARTAHVYIAGRQIVSATFYLDGRRVKTITKPDRSARYGIDVNARKLRFGVHRVKVIVVVALSACGGSPASPGQRMERPARLRRFRGSTRIREQPMPVAPGLTMSGRR